MAVSRFDQVPQHQVVSGYVPLNLPMKEMAGQVHAKDQMQRQALDKLGEERREMDDILTEAEGFESVTLPDGTTYDFYTNMDAMAIRDNFAKGTRELANRLASTDLTEGAGELASEWAERGRQARQMVSPDGVLGRINRQREEMEAVVEDMRDNSDELRKDPSLLNPYHQFFASRLAGTMGELEGSPINSVRGASINRAIQHDPWGLSPDSSYTFSGPSDYQDPMGLVRDGMKNLKSSGGVSSFTPDENQLLVSRGWSGVSESRIRSASRQLMESNTQLQGILSERADHAILQGQLSPEDRNAYIEQQKKDLEDQAVAEYKHGESTIRARSRQAGVGTEPGDYNIQPYGELRVLEDMQFDAGDVSSPGIFKILEGVNWRETGTGVVGSIGQGNMNLDVEGNMVLPMRNISIEDEFGETKVVRRAGSPEVGHADAMTVNDMTLGVVQTYTGEEPITVGGVTYEKGDIIDARHATDQRLNADNVDAKHFGVATGQYQFTADGRRGEMKDFHSLIDLEDSAVLNRFKTDPRFEALYESHSKDWSQNPHNAANRRESEEDAVLNLFQ